MLKSKNTTPQYFARKAVLTTCQNGFFSKILRGSVFLNKFN
jgi:hypothetical protein